MPAGPPTIPTVSAPDIVKCSIHGLSYNRARSSGCLHCPQPAREAAPPASKDPVTRLLSGLDAGLHPIRRAFAGLALALAIGFLPAAYYTFGISGGEVRRIRVRQAALSEQPGTAAVLDEFDGLEAAISKVRRRGFEHAAVLWVLVTAIAGGALYRLVGRREGAAPGN
jgi:hypothetical protein